MRRGGGDSGNGIAIDGENNAYVVGTTFSDFVTTPGAFQTVRQGTTDAFILKIAEVASLSATAVDFGSQPLGITSPVQSTTLTNNGTSALTIGTVSVSGANSTDFEITLDTCSGQILASGSSCSVGATFTPAAIGARAATVVIPDNVPDSPLNVALSGTGVGFSITGSPSTVTLSAGDQAAYSVTVTPQGGTFSNSVFLTCSLPATLTFASCSLSPPSVNPGSNPATSTLTVKTAGPSSAALTYPKRPERRWYTTSGAALACILLFVIPARRSRWRTMLGMLALFVTLTGALLACGGGSGGGGGGGGGGNPGTTAGTYTLTVTGTSGSLTETGTVTLTVQ